MKFRHAQYPQVSVHDGEREVRFVDHEHETDDAEVIAFLKRTPGVEVVRPARKLPVEKE